MSSGKVGNDWLALFAPPSGFVEGEVTFLHKSAACDDDRLLLTPFTQGLVYPAQVHSGSIFYTKTLDPNNQIAVTVLGQERFTAGQGRVRSRHVRSVSVQRVPAVWLVRSSRRPTRR